MKFNIRLGAFAIVCLLNACGTPAAEDPGPAHDGNATGGSTGDGYDATGGSNSSGEANAAGAPSDGHGAAGSKSNAAGNTAGAKNASHGDVAGSKSNGAGAAPGSMSDGEGEAAGSASDGDGEAAGSTGDDGGAGDLDGSTGGIANSAGSNGVSGSAGSGGVSGTGGFGGLASSAAGGASSSAGSGGVAGSGGFGGLAGSGGFGGLAGSGGVGGLSSSGGFGGLTSSGGSAGSAGDSSLDAEYLFTTETFGGNGRTCVTCHTAETGTISPDQVQALYSESPDDPLFRPLDSDDGASDDYGQLQTHATFRVTIALPPGVVLTSDPSATSVVFRRGAPSTINTPALDSVLMWDGREPSLTAQALSAILGHAQATVTPTDTQLELIAGFEQGYDFFSSDVLRQYAQGGPAPTWPPGGTASEQRGRRWFAEDSAAPRFNVCGQCHGGPMANTTASNSGLPVGQRFQTVNVSEFNTLGNPTYQFTFPDPTHPGQTVTVVTPDPGRALITGDVRDVNFFKIPSLWGIKNTAPYFHDNSADTLEELMDHYEKHLATFLSPNLSYPFPHVPTAQDKADIIAYLELL
jgi:cytochrome c553